MTVFDRIQSTYKRLKREEEKLSTLQIKAGVPRTSVFSDMPKGGGSTINAFDQYLIDQEELEKKIRVLKGRMNRQWEKALKQMQYSNIDEQSQKMMYYRFVKGMQWEKCATQLAKDFPDCKWNVGKCFRRYREVLYKIRKAEDGQFYNCS